MDKTTQLPFQYGQFKEGIEKIKPDTLRDALAAYESKAQSFLVQVSIARKTNRTESDTVSIAWMHYREFKKADVKVDRVIKGLKAVGPLDWKSEAHVEGIRDVIRAGLTQYIAVSPTLLHALERRVAKDNPAVRLFSYVASVIETRIARRRLLKSPLFLKRPEFK